MLSDEMYWLYFHNIHVRLSHACPCVSMCRLVHRPVYVPRRAVAYVYLSSVHMCLRVYEFACVPVKPPSSHFRKQNSARSDSNCARPRLWNVMYAETKEAIPAAMNGLDGIKDGCRESKGSTQGETVKMDEHGRTWMNMAWIKIVYVVKRTRLQLLWGRAGLFEVMERHRLDHHRLRFYHRVPWSETWFVCVLRYGLFSFVERLLSSALFWNKDTGRWTWWTHLRNPSQIELQCLDLIW